ncbi:unnamed protein product [Cylindrotheca closterium]|uniref:DUF6824 domain-containing protein n=1 Tax=Cylindrotheca closterium TaxID=2856 RepID=A0AAD2CQW6_9STRA|nr:unnamed protein product [Cylindrotheca closterium]
MCSPQANPPSNDSITNATPLVGLPTDVDIVCGRGRGVWSHPGNLKFKLLIECNLPAYSQAVRRKEKSLIINHVLHTMILTGARFVKQQRNVWYALDEKEAREKTAHAMRDFSKRRRQDQDPQKTNNKKRKRIKKAQAPTIAVAKPDWTNFQTSAPTTFVKRSFSEPQTTLSRSLLDFKMSSYDDKEESAATLPHPSLPKSKSLSDLYKSFDMEPRAVFSTNTTPYHLHARLPTRIDRDDERLQLFHMETTDPLQNLFGSAATDEPNLSLKSSVLDESSENFNLPDFC